MNFLKSLWIIFFFIHLTNGSGWSEDFSSNQMTGNDRTPVSDEKAKEYLQTFGYIQPSHFLDGSSDSEGDFHDPTAVLKSAITKFQKYMGLPTTGELDVPTKKKMAEPRCGVYDVQAISSGRKAVFKWDKRNLTYSITSYSRDLPEDNVVRAIRSAFDTWSEVVPLDFTEVRSHDESADIKIKFASDSHGDPWPFDGRGGVLAHATMPTNGLLHFDDAEDWIYMDPEKIANGHTDVLAVAIHEIGHALGLSHSRNEDSIMAPIYTKTVDRHGNYVAPKLITSDIKDIQSIYGPRQESFHRESTAPPESESSSERTVELEGEYCPTTVDAVSDAPDGSHYFFSGGTVYEYNNGRFLKTHSLRSLFPNGPVSVDAVISNEFWNSLLLFKDRTVYLFNYFGNQWILSTNFPKRLPPSIRFKPYGGMLWIDGHQILFSDTGIFAIYDEFWNQAKKVDKLSKYLPNFPSTVKGGFSTGGTELKLFSTSLVYTYDGIRRTRIGQPESLSSFLGC